MEDFDGARVIRLKAPKTKDIGYVRRTIGEFLMPFAMLRNLRRSPLAGEKWDGVVWYAPTIFLGPIASALKKASGCRGYLIIRDIFPEWAVDMGLMGRGLPYRFFDAVARYQYSVADVIGVQTPGNKGYFAEWTQRPGRRLEVLQNWLGAPADAPSTIVVGETVLASVNAGNDLVGLIEQERVGRAVTDASAASLARAALELVDAVSADDGFAARCRGLSARLFSAETAVRQVVAALA